jgi:hypothetical protein
MNEYWRQLKIINVFPWELLFLRAVAVRTRQYDSLPVGSISSDQQ